MPDVNKPTGLGYQGTWTRCCAYCGLNELQHFGRTGTPGFICNSIGFATRELTELELTLCLNPPTPDATKYEGEAFDFELKAEIARQRGTPIMKLPETVGRTN